MFYFTARKIKRKEEKNRKEESIRYSTSFYEKVVHRQDKTFKAIEAVM